MQQPNLTKPLDIKHPNAPWKKTTLISFSFPICAILLVYYSYKFPLISTIFQDKLPIQSPTNLERERNYLMDTKPSQTYPCIHFIFNQCNNISEKKNQYISHRHICLRNIFSPFLSIKMRITHMWTQEKESSYLLEYISSNESLVSTIGID